MELAVAAIAVDKGLFKLIAASDEPLTSDDLASKAGVDPILMSRILRFMASFRFIKEVGEGQFAPSNVTKTFARPGYEDGIWFQ